MCFKETFLMGHYVMMLQVEGGGASARGAGGAAGRAAQEDGLAVGAFDGSCGGQPAAERQPPVLAVAAGHVRAAGRGGERRVGVGHAAPPQVNHQRRNLY